MYGCTVVCTVQYAHTFKYMNARARIIIKFYYYFTGGIGAKRFCSSKDLGNYCNYVENKGDRMEYRSCIYTCDTDGCNHSSQIRLNHMIFGAVSSIIAVTTLKLLIWNHRLEVIPKRKFISFEMYAHTPRTLYPKHSVNVVLFAIKDLCRISQQTKSVHENFEKRWRYFA